MTSRMFFGGWLYPEDVSAGSAAVFEEDDTDCAAAGAQNAQTTNASISSAPAKRRFLSLRKCMSFLRLISVTSNIDNQ